MVVGTRHHSFPLNLRFQGRRATRFSGGSFREAGYRLDMAKRQQKRAGAAAGLGVLVFLAAALGNPSSGGLYFFSPSYETVSAESRLAAKVDPSRDIFVSESISDQIALRLDELGRQLEQSSENWDRVAEMLAEGFQASGWGGREAAIRSESPLRLDRGDASQEEGIGRDRFLQQFRSLAAAYRPIETAEFEIAGIVVDSQRDPTRVETRVDFNIVGVSSGAARQRMQQSGQWVMDWRRTAQKPWLVHRWKAGKWTRASASRRLFADVSEPALGANDSYRRQLRRGVDDWRSRLDGALGVDVYGLQGVSAGDFDGDGNDDLYISQPSGLPNRLLRNDGGLAFSDVTGEAGVGVLDGTSMSLFADADNDGDQDLIVISARTPLLLRNDGKGRFRNEPGSFAFSSPPQGQLTSAAMADYDLDGDLDLYVCAYRYHGGTGPRHAPTPYHDANNGPPNFFFRNRGDGTFQDATRAAGLDRNNTRFSFAASWADYDADGRPDLYVANDFGRNNLYRNNGDGTFTDAAARLGVEDVGAGMSASWFDYDRDGRLDLYVGNMWSAAGLRISAQSVFQRASPGELRRLYQRHAKGNTLFRGQAQGLFSESTSDAGVAHGRWAWSSDALDFDNDGHEDIYVANGYVTQSDTKDL